MGTPHSVIVGRSRACRAAPTTTGAILGQVMEGRALLQDALKIRRQAVRVVEWL